MKLVNTALDFTVLEFEGNETKFHDNYMKREMEEIGIRVPYLLQNLYNNKRVIKLTDDQFQKAFKEIYYPLVLDESKFKWID
ncbi:MAG: hypothetical protein WD595_04985 [Waddliaceae bacterium]